MVRIVSGQPNIRLFKDKEALDRAATEHVIRVISDALATRGKASAMLSGGSSPKPLYNALAHAPLAWDGVGVSLVDERWVPSGSEGSNADVVRACFAGTPAERAHFIPLYNGHPTPHSGVEAAEQAVAALAQPFDLCILGMGMDGHTASWFPHSGGLSAALDPDAEAVLAAIDATGCEVAGEYPSRITMTFRAINEARANILLLPSAEKLDIFRTAKEKDKMDAPVKALYSLGERLTVYALEASS